MPTKRVFLTALTAGTALAGPFAMAKDAPLQPLPPVAQAVADCRTIDDATQRLACFDRTVATMVEAHDKHDLVVADRATMKETKRGLFGFTLPKLKLFGGTEGDDIDQIDARIASVRHGQDGYAILTLEDGARWKQTDGGEAFAKQGSTITIRRAALGSFMAKVDGGRSFRVIRLTQ